MVKPKRRTAFQEAAMQEASNLLGEIKQGYAEADALLQRRLEKLARIREKEIALSHLIEAGRRITELDFDEWHEWQEATGNYPSAREILIFTMDRNPDRAWEVSELLEQIQDDCWRVDEGAIRTAISRATADGEIERISQGTYRRAHKSAA